MNMKQMVTILALCCMILAAGPGIALAGGGDLPAPEAQAVYEFITEASPYQQWSLFPGKGKLYKGQHPHGALLTTYVNGIAERGIRSDADMLDGGSIIVKENYMPDKTLGAVTVMYRVDGYNPDAGDWFWAKYKANGEVEKAGKVKGCIGCHTAALDNDWIFTGR